MESYRCKSRKFVFPGYFASYQYPGEDTSDNLSWGRCKYSGSWEKIAAEEDKSSEQREKKGGDVKVDEAAIQDEGGVRGDSEAGREEGAQDDGGGGSCGLTQKPKHSLCVGEELNLFISLAKVSFELR